MAYKRRKVGFRKRRGLKRKRSGRASKYARPYKRFRGASYKRKAKRNEKTFNGLFTRRNSSARLGSETVL